MLGGELEDQAKFNVYKFKSLYFLKVEWGEREMFLYIRTPVHNKFLILSFLLFSVCVCIYVIYFYD